MIKPSIILIAFSVVMLALFIAIKGDGSPKCCPYHVKEYQVHNNTTNVVEMTDKEREEFLRLMSVLNLMNSVVFQ